MKVIDNTSTAKGISIGLGDVILDLDHKGYYIIASTEEYYSLVGFDGSEWGNYQTFRDLEEELKAAIRDGRFIYYQKDRYKLTIDEL